MIIEIEKNFLVQIFNGFMESKQPPKNEHLSGRCNISGDEVTPEEKAKHKITNFFYNDVWCMPCGGFDKTNDY